MLFTKSLTIVHLNSKLWNQLVPIPSSCGSSGAVRFSSRAVRPFPSLLERGVRPSYRTFFHMVFQGNCARVRTGHMIIIIIIIIIVIIKLAGGFTWVQVFVLGLFFPSRTGLKFGAHTTVSLGIFNPRQLSLHSCRFPYIA